ncbi:Ribosomal protein S3 [Rhizoctonia solani]|uniref:40S ribosomal protein S3 n=1 Tax=Rhizoctonia solani TaxID=456999 RepID=A0A8H7I9B9_9AGAM|nr:Ribosomal protein S3 [Rhizoctonia solani]
MASQISKKRKFVADGVFRAELGEFFTANWPRRDTLDIIIRATRTQDVLGEKGRRIRELTSLIQKRFKFPENSLDLYAEKVQSRGLSAVAQCESLRYKLLGGLAVRRACYGVLRFVMESGAKGCEVVVSGKLRAARAKSMKFTDGFMIHSGQPARDFVDYAVRHVLLRQGVLGIKVKIMKGWDPTGNLGPKKPLPDTVTIQEPPIDKVVAEPTSEHAGAAEPISAPAPLRQPKFRSLDEDHHLFPFPPASSRLGATISSLYYYLTWEYHVYDSTGVENVIQSSYSDPRPALCLPTTRSSRKERQGPNYTGPPTFPPLEYDRHRSPISSLSKNPWVIRAVKAIAPFMGYYSKTTTAIRETRPMYAKCGERLEQETDFLYKAHIAGIECALPPTYQTWFQFTLLHVLILTARLRALPPDDSRTYQAELINHFFLDIEHRMRAVLGPKVPERIVKGYLNEMRDQWRGGGVAFDLGIIDTDATLAGMIWRNLFASRDGKERRVLLASAQDIELPSSLYKFVVHVRRELKRLEGISDEDIKLGHIGEWGTVSSIQAPEGAADYEAWQATGQTIRTGGKQAAASG